jgi:Fe-Mn family superoxide dismutase
LIDDNGRGHLSGYVPNVLLDAWGHAFIMDYNSAERGKYIEAFFANIDWKVCEARLQQRWIRQR